MIAARPDTIRERSDQLARRIVDDVLAGIAAGDLPSGTRLSDERSLCRRYFAGRHTVRKAMEELEGRGLVGRFVGRGSFVLDTPTPREAPAAAPSRNWTLLELTEARLLLEPAVSALAAERRTAEDLAKLARALAAITGAETWRSFKEAKYAFHRLVAEIAGNAFILEVFDRIIASRRQAWDGYRPRPQDLASARAASLAENQAILDAIGDEDGPRAAEAVRSSVARLLVSITGS